MYGVINLNALAKLPSSMISRRGCKVSLSLFCFSLQLHASSFRVYLKGRYSQRTDTSLVD